MLELLQNWGLLPDPILFVSLMRIFLFEDLDLDTWAYYLAIVIFGAAMLWQLLRVTAATRTEMIVPVLIRALFLGGLLSAYGTIQNATLNLWVAGYELGTKASDRIVQSALSDNFLLDMASLVTGGVGLSVAKATGKLLSKEALIQALQENKAVARQAVEAGTGQALKTVNTILNYANLVGLVMAPVFIMVVLAVAVSGIMILLGNLFLPLALALYLSSLIGVRMLFLWGRAFLGGWMAAILVPLMVGVVFGAAIAAPLKYFKEQYDDIVNRPDTFIERVLIIGPIIKAASTTLQVALALLGSIVGLVVAIYLAGLMVRKVGDYAVYFIEGAFFGGDADDMAHSGRLLKRTTLFMTRDGPPPGGGSPSGPGGGDEGPRGPGGGGKGPRFGQNPLRPVAPLATVAAAEKAIASAPGGAVARMRAFFNDMRAFNTQYAAWKRGETPEPVRVSSLFSQSIALTRGGALKGTLTPIVEGDYDEKGAIQDAKINTTELFERGYAPLVSQLSFKLGNWLKRTNEGKE